MELAMDGSAAAGSLARCATRAVHLLRRKAEASLGGRLGLDEWLVLDALVQGPRTMSGMAEETAIPGPTLTRVVDRLVSEAKAYREVHPADRRKVQVHLAPRGLQLHRELSGTIRLIEDEVVSELGLRAPAAARS